MYAKWAQYYDAIYAAIDKDYAAEVATLETLIQRDLKSSGRHLLDVACGTGLHLLHFKEKFAVAGLELDANMLELARGRLPEVPLYLGDMLDFALEERFDVVTCLFSAIGYADTEAKLHRAIANMGDHLAPGGLLIVEPWLTPDAFQEGRVGAVFVDQPELKIARMNVGVLEGNLTVLDFHFLVATPEGVEHFTERHAMALYTQEEYLQAFRAAGLEPGFEAEGLMGRGIYLGRKPLE